MKDKIMARLNENGLTIPLVMIFGLVGLITMIILVFSADLAKGTLTVDVTAVVATSVSCDADPTSTDFATITTSAVKTSSPNASTTITCNYGAGCTLSVNDVGDGTNPGLATSSPAYLIQSVTETLVAGSQEGYGLQATTTAAGSGGTLTISATYDKAGDDVGGMATSTSPVQVASSTIAITNREVLITHKAAITGLTTAANYVDTITYSCLGN